MRLWAKTLGLLSVLVFLSPAACHQAPVLRATVELSPEYRRAVLEWTANGALYNRLHRRVEVYAVVFAPRLRQEFARRYRELFGFEITSGRGDLEASFLASEGKAAALVVLECDDLRLCDISRPDAVWKIMLQAAGESVLPVRISRLRTPRPTIEGFFPFAGGFFQAFWVDWPLGAGQAAAASGLLITSPYGRLQLRWPGEGAER